MTTKHEAKPSAKLIADLREAALEMQGSREDARRVEIARIGRKVHHAPAGVTNRAIAAELAREAEADAKLKRVGLSEGMLSRDATLYRVCVLWAGYAPEEVSKYPLKKLYAHVRQARQGTAQRVVQSVMRDFASLPQQPRKARAEPAPAPGGETTVKVTTETKERLTAAMKAHGEETADAMIARMLTAWETPQASEGQGEGEGLEA